MSTTGKISLVIFAILMIVPSIVLWGWCFTIMWGWFVVPIFAVPTLSLAQGLGLSTTIRGMIVYAGHRHDERGAEEKLISAIFETLGYPMIWLGFGWIIKGFL